MRNRAALEPLSVPAFRLLFAGRAADGVATAIAPVALAFAVLDLGGSTTSLGLVLAARTVPMVVFMLVGGVIADRLPRHQVVLTANLVSAATSALVATLLATGTASVAILAAIAALNGVAAAFLFPAASGLTAQTVPGSLLQPANALLRLGINGSLVLGSATGGGLVAAAGPGWGFALDSCLYLVAAALLSRIRLPREDRVPGSNVVQELHEGWQEFRSRTWLWVVVVQFAFLNMAGAAAFTTLGPVIADRTVGRAVWGIVLAAQTVGMMVGGFISLRGGWPRPLLIGVVASLAEAPLLFALGWRPQALALILTAFAAGVGIEVFGVVWDVSLQSNVPEDRLSRVYAYDWFGSLVFVPIGQALAGPLASATSLSIAPVIFGTTMLLATAGALSSGSVRRLRRVEVEEAAA